MMKMDNQPRLTSYYLWFFLIYFLTIVAANLITQILIHYGLAANWAIIPIEIQIIALMAASLYTALRFARKQKRFFTAAELNKMIFGTTLIPIAFQLISSALLLSFETYRLRNNTNPEQDPVVASYLVLLQHPIAILIAIIIITIVVFLLQTLNFRVIARRMVKKTQ